jgi:hypothetical protein
MRGCPAHPQQAGGIPGVETAGHVGAGDDLQHRIVIAKAPHAKALAQVGVEVDTGHATSLGAYCLTTLAAICAATSIAGEPDWL